MELIKEITTSSYTTRTFHDLENKFISIIPEGKFDVEVSIEMQRYVVDYIKDNSNSIPLLVYDFKDLKGSFTQADHISFIKEEYIPNLIKNEVKDILFYLNSDPFTVFALNAVTKIIKEPAVHTTTSRDKFEAKMHELIESIKQSEN